jgi:hypothetical protein
MNDGSNFWTDAKTAEAKRLYVTEGFSATQVAVMVGATSRNAVIGKAHRENWQRDPLKALENNRASSRARGPRPAPKGVRRRPLDGLTFTGHAKPKQQYQERPQPSVGPIDSPNAKVWTERGRFECAFIVEGEGADATACCNRAWRKSSWCRDHHAVVFQSGTRIHATAIASSVRWAEAREERLGAAFDKWAAA